ncbi:MAG: VCBS repeat-containing protein [Fimbriimonadaceae bacterium]|nr:VCBS repeat-containing protein [Fimbriimonadaceae bacterium]
MTLTWLLCLTLAPPPAFVRQQLDAGFRSEGVAVADFDGDGQLDLAAGRLLYRGPDWRPTPLLGEPPLYPRENYSDAFLCFADDLNGDRRLDLLIVGFPNAETIWLANPGPAGGPWARHLAVPKTGSESPTYADVDADGRRELIYMAPAGLALAQPGLDPTTPWPTRVVAAAGDPRPGHGLGVGDLNADGRADLICPGGWWQQPTDRATLPWPFHAAQLTEDCAQIAVQDVDGDGDADLLSSSAHRYGVWWTEQTPTGWQRHEIDQLVSQTHALHLADLDGDGLLDFVTGKRFWAHRQGDPGVDEPAVLAWYRLTRSPAGPRWERHVIDTDSGVGLHFQIVDVNGDRRLDLAVANKKGVFLFVQATPPAATRPGRP